MNKCIVLFLAATFLLSARNPVQAQGDKPLYTAPLGVEAFTYRKSFPIDVAKTLDTIKMMGFTELEGGGGRMPPEEFRKLCDARGISIPSIGAGYDQLVKSPDSVIDKAKALGANYVMCAWIPHSNGVLSFANAQQAVTDFNRIGKTLKEHGLIFCYHAHGYEFQPYEDGTLLDYIFKNTDPEYVSFEMDIMWIQFGGGDPVALLKKYGSRWKLMHLKDLRKGAPKNLTGLTGPENDVPLGMGEVDIPNILKEARKLGIKHYFIEDESNNVNEQVPQSIRYLKGLKG
ncbi:MAG TPA: sugar phosphate isomerase/epimerase [Puia sp.]|nr:sugar phosphate isomerase/epimerase [Puia sp.]